MHFNEASQIIGYTARRNDIKNMVTALSMLPFMNSKEDNIRLLAGKMILKNWTRYQRVCNEARNNRVKIVTKIG